MSVFRKKGNKSFIGTIAPSLIVIILIIICFSWGFSEIFSSSSERQKENLESSIMRSIMNSYAIEGVYPDSLDYIKVNYGLVYDESQFYVDYKVLGSNIMPDVTIIDLKE